MDPGDLLSSTIASVSLIATATLAYRQTLAETTERVQVVVSWKDEAGPH